MESRFQPLPAARLYVWLTAALGMTVLVFTLANWESPDLIKYAGFLAAAICTSGMRVAVPGINGPLPLTFVFVLIGVLDLSQAETILLGVFVTLVQCYWNQTNRPRWIETVFHVSSMIVAIEATERVYQAPFLLSHQIDPAIRLAAATCTLFLFSTAQNALPAAFQEHRGFVSTWREDFFWSLPYYLGGAAVAKCASLLNHYVGWQTVLLTGPVVYLIYRSYRLYLERLENEKRHAEEVSSLHLRTIEALALAIEAKDHTTHDHLQRVQVYAMDLARQLGLSAEQQEALRAASILHDIGKLAVPEHIISKPGRLTPEEFEKMKIHPVVGAEILERVQFPYPVVPIVRAHHEKWDGTGYPYGLAGEEIPIGARILAAVDCLDALATDRQYRRALPLDEAMRIVQSESGKAFDPKIVDLLARSYVELERRAQSANPEASKLSVGLKVERGEAPAAGFESSSRPEATPKNSSMDFLTSIAAARQEVQALFEISQDLGNSLSLDETLSVLAVRLRKIIPHHSLAIWIRRGAVLQPDYVSGDDFRLFSTLEIPMGQGLSGWVAENRKPILNGNPSVEPGYLNDAQKFSTLRAAVAVPLEGMNGVLGVLSLYHAERDAFTKDHLRILLAISGKIGMSIENALRFRQAESSATTDYMTALPNARSLFLQLDAEISRARRGRTPLAVLVIDLDGFKLVNDRFGHLEGNKVLLAVATGLKHACREYDYIARMGGDEFVVLLPSVEPADIPAKIVQLREVVHDIGRQMFSGSSLTASIGVAHFPIDGEDAEELLAEADRRMYKEKRSRANSPRALGPAWKTEWPAIVQ
ncbi:MAG TPA: HD domain-containing phosphohydrolase [Bryobacteraceae bacterium]|jgi:diguanylate cyclase (GGDEF)-like protein/putative nucleotidyltransferase with HDIG domain|nr:HD domain-containing phosphohydrolase [Bryobacteraceae bacterium]